MSRLDEIDRRWNPGVHISGAQQIEDAVWLIAELRKSQARVRELEAAGAECVMVADIVANKGVMDTVRVVLAREAADAWYQVLAGGEAE